MQLTLEFVPCGAITIRINSWSRPIHNFRTACELLNYLWMLGCDVILSVSLGNLWENKPPGEHTTENHQRKGGSRSTSPPAGTGQCFASAETWVCWHFASTYWGFCWRYVHDCRLPTASTTTTCSCTGSCSSASTSTPSSTTAPTPSTYAE